VCNNKKKWRKLGFWGVSGLREIGAKKGNGSDGRDQMGIGDDGRWCSDAMVVLEGD
jgi:hypothetical protein